MHCAAALALVHAACAETVVRIDRCMGKIATDIQDDAAARATRLIPPWWLSTCMEPAHLDSSADATRKLVVR